MKYLYFTISILLFIGCSSLGNYDFKAGVEDYRVPSENNSSQIVTKFFEFDENNRSSYFEANDIIDIRLSNIMFNELYDFTLAQNKNRKTNHIGIFVSVKEINSFNNQDVNSTVFPEKALIYVDRVYTKAYANQSFTPIYIQKYNGGDLQIQLDVVEFDKNEESGRFLPLLKEISSLTKKAIVHKLNGLDMESLNELGKSLVDTFLVGHNDLIASYRFNFVGHDSIVNKKGNYLPYLKEGDLVLVEREAGDANNDITKWKDFSYNSKLKRIEPKYGSKVFKDWYSSIVLTFIRKKSK